MEEHIKEILLDLKPDIDTECTELVSSGILDSFDIVMILQKIENILGIKIPASKILLENFESVQDIAKMVELLNTGSNK